MRKIYLILIISGILIFSSIGISTGTTVTLTPTDDSIVNMGSANENYGSFEYLKARMVIDQQGQITAQERSYLKFDLSNIPDNAIITSASLNLFFKTATGLHFGGLTSLHHVEDDSWLENTITWNSQPIQNLEYATLLNVRPKPDLPEDKWESWDLFAEESWIYSSDLLDNSLSLLLSLEATGTEYVWPYCLFSSKERNEYLLPRPELLVEYVLPSIADAGPDQVVFDEVILDGSGSSNTDGTIVSFDWLLQHREDSAYDRTVADINPTISDLEPGFYDVTLTVTDDGGQTDTDTSVVAAAGSCVSTASTMYIESIVAGTVRGSKGNSKGEVIVTVSDDYGKPVAGSTVTGTFFGDFDEIGSEVTDSNGVAVIRTTEQVKKPLYEFCVDSVDKESLVYIPDDNVETCKGN